MEESLEEAGIKIEPGEEVGLITKKAAIKKMKGLLVKEEVGTIERMQREEAKEAVVEEEMMLMTKEERTFRNRNHYVKGMMVLLKKISPQKAEVIEHKIEKIVKQALEEALKEI